MQVRSTLLVIAFMILAGCSAAEVAGDPAHIVEQYIEAKAAGDADVIGELLCSEMEADLSREARSFASVEARIEEMTCSQDGESDVVRCEGRIVATYGLEDRDFPLTAYRVVQEDGEWRWCGEAQ